jgi:hypothetical protein
MQRCVHSIADMLRTYGCSACVVTDAAAEMISVCVYGHDALQADASALPAAQQMGVMAPCQATAAQQLAETGLSWLHSDLGDRDHAHR